MSPEECADVFVDKVIDKLAVGWRVNRYTLPDGVLIQMYRSGTSKTNTGKPRQAWIIFLNSLEDGMGRVGVREGRGDGPDDDQYMLHVRDSRRIADWLTE